MPKSACPPQGCQAREAADHEGGPPAPFRHGGAITYEQEHQERALREHQAADDGRPLEGCEESAVPPGAGLRQQHGGGRVLSPGGDPLHDAHDDEDHGGPSPDRALGRRDGKSERSGRYEGDRGHEGRHPPPRVRELAEQPRAHRSHDERHGEQRVHVDQRVGRLRVEELGPEVRREDRVDVQVEPLGEVGHGSGEDGSRAAAAVEARVGCDRGRGVHALTLAKRRARCPLGRSRVRRRRRGARRSDVHPTSRTGRRRPPP